MLVLCKKKEKIFINEQEEKNRYKVNRVVIKRIERTCDAISGYQHRCNFQYLVLVTSFVRSRGGKNDSSK